MHMESPPAHHSVGPLLTSCEPQPGSDPGIPYLPPSPHSHQLARGPPSALGRSHLPATPGAGPQFQRLFLASPCQTPCALLLQTPPLPSLTLVTPHPRPLPPMLGPSALLPLPLCPISASAEGMEGCWEEGPEDVGERGMGGEARTRATEPLGATAGGSLAV